MITPSRPNERKLPLPIVASIRVIIPVFEEATLKSAALKYDAATDINKTKAPPQNNVIHPSNNLPLTKIIQSAIATTSKMSVRKASITFNVTVATNNVKLIPISVHLLMPTFSVEQAAASVQ